MPGQGTPGFPPSPRRAQPGERARPAQRGGRGRAHSGAGGVARTAGRAGSRAQRADLDPSPRVRGLLPKPASVLVSADSPGREDECSCLSGDGVSPPAAGAVGSRSTSTTATGSGLPQPLKSMRRSDSGSCSEPPTTPRAAERGKAGGLACVDGGSGGGWKERGGRFPVQGIGRNTGSPAGGVARANGQPARVRSGRSGWRRGP